MTIEIWYSEEDQIYIAEDDEYNLTKFGLTKLQAVEELLIAVRLYKIEENKPNKNESKSN